MSAPAAFDTRLFRDVMGHYPTGVTVVTTISDGKPIGMVANSFVSVSLSPPLVSFCPAKGSATWEQIEQAGHFCVNFLHRDQEALSRRFAARGTDRFAGVEWTLTPGGAPRLLGSVAWVDCAVHDQVNAGDHVIALGRVRELDVVSGAAPLVFYRGHYRLP